MTAQPDADLTQPLSATPNQRRGRRRGGRRRAWLPALLALTVAFLVFSLPPYLGFDPARSRLPTHPDLPTYYPMLVGHILFGSVALVTGCLQVWPWLRSRFPVVHRWVGRLYLFGGVFPAGVVVLGVAPLSSTGFASAVGNTLLAVLWLVTSVAGYRAARQRRYADHRVWMVRGLALTLSIVLNRVWLVALLLLGMGVRGMYGVDEAAMAASAATASVWLSWTANLLFVEWFVLRPRRRPTPR
jgi:hypothetical protein